MGFLLAMSWRLTCASALERLLSLGDPLALATGTGAVVRHRVRPSLLNVTCSGQQAPVVAVE